MINTIYIKQNKSKVLVKNIPENVFLLPKWEKIKTFSVIQNNLFFKKTILNLSLFRKFSSKNMLEKYCIKTQDNVELANMDLRIYKDCVYIINLNFQNNNNISNILLELIQVAIEKSLYNTTEEELKINLNFPLNKRNKIKKLLTSNEFFAEENQSDYEKEMFGETLTFKMTKSSKWMKIIKQAPILINNPF